MERQRLYLRIFGKAKHTDMLVNGSFSLRVNLDLLSAITWLEIDSLLDWFWLLSRGIYGWKKMTLWYLNSQPDRIWYSRSRMKKNTGNHNYWSLGGNECDQCWQCHGCICLFTSWFYPITVKLLNMVHFLLRTLKRIAKCLGLGL